MGNNWLETTLEEACLVVTDGAHNSPKSVVDDGLPMASVKDLTRYGITLETCRLISEDDFQKLVKWGSKPQKGDVLIAKDGATALDTICEIREDINVVLLSSVAILRTNPDIMLPAYLRYYLDSPTTRAYMKGSFITGAAIPRVVLKDFKRVKIHIPPLPTQRRIADILSAYDDLIENNTRRIRILEGMAQAIYAETVHAPSVRCKESLPEGWRTERFVDVCNELIDGDWIETKDQGGEDYRLLQVSNIGLGDFVETGNFRYITEETFERLNCNEIIPGDILISRMPKPIGRGWLVTKMPWRMITAVDVAIARPNPDLLNRHYCIHWLNSPETLAKSEQHSSGTTRPRITRRDLAGFEMVVPPIELQNKFGKIAEELYKLQTNLRRKNDNLRQTRDLLLPRLVSGETAV